MSADRNRELSLINHGAMVESGRTLAERLDTLATMARLVDLVARGLVHDETCVTGDHELMHEVSWVLPLLAEQVRREYEQAAKKPKAVA
jgi:hypothetical protein